MIKEKMLFVVADLSIISLVDSDGMTPLCLAAANDSIPCASLLLDRGSNVNFANEKGQTPLHFAAQSGSKTMANLILDRGGRLESADSDGIRPLEAGIAQKNLEVVNLCLKKGAKLGPQTWFLANEKPEILLMLLNKLCEDGNLLYKKNRIKDANHRYNYALRKFPANSANFDRGIFDDLKSKLLINYARCQRKLGVSQICGTEGLRGKKFPSGSEFQVVPAPPSSLPLS